MPDIYNLEDMYFFNDDSFLCPLYIKINLLGAKKKLSVLHSAQFNFSTLRAFYISFAVILVLQFLQKLSSWVAQLSAM